MSADASSRLGPATPTCAAINLHYVYCLGRSVVTPLSAAAVQLLVYTLASLVCLPSLTPMPSAVLSYTALQEADAGKDGRVGWDEFLVLMRDRSGVDTLVAAYL